MITQNATGAQPAKLPPRPDDREYIVWSRGIALTLYWSEMTRRQRELQVEAEKRQSDIEEFGIYS